MNNIINKNPLSQQFDSYKSTLNPAKPLLNKSMLNSETSILESTDQGKSFIQKMQKVHEACLVNVTKFARKKACALIGFPGSTKAFSIWLREKGFLCYDDTPAVILMKRGLLDFHQKSIYSSVKFDCCNKPISGNDYDGRRLIKTVITPLFTHKGIEYFKTLLADDDLLASEVQKIKLNNQLLSNQN